MDLRKYMGGIIRNRVGRMVEHILPSVVTSGNLLDIGCSSALIAQEIERRTRMEVVGVDVMCPPGTQFPVVIYDGKKLPFPDRAFTNVMLCFVLHHCEDPIAVLREAVRVCNTRLVVVEDIAETPFQRKKAVFKDWLYNKITVPDMNLTYNFKSTREWLQIFDSLELKVVRSHPAPSMVVNPVKQVLFALDKPPSNGSGAA